MGKKVGAVKPKLAQGVIAVSSANGHWLYSSTKTLALKEVLNHKISLPLIARMDGTRTVAELCKAMRPHKAEIVKQVIERIEKAGFLERESPPIKGKRIVVIDSGIFGDGGRKIFADAGLDDIAWMPFKTRGKEPVGIWKLLASGNPEGVGEIMNDCSLVVLGLHVRHHSIASMVNKACLASKTPLFLVKVEESKISMLTVWPFETACEECCHSWRFNNDSRYREKTQIEGGVNSGSWSDLMPDPPVKTLAASLAGIEASRLLLSPQSAASISHEIELDLQTLESTFHPVMKNPRCPLCSLHAATASEQKEQFIDNGWKFDRSLGAFVPA